MHQRRAYAFVSIACRAEKRYRALCWHPGEIGDAEMGLAKIAGAATMPEEDSNHTVFSLVIEHLSQKATRKSFASGSAAWP